MNLPIELIEAVAEYRRVLESLQDPNSDGDLRTDIEAEEARADADRELAQTVDSLVPPSTVAA